MRRIRATVLVAALALSATACVSTPSPSPSVPATGTPPPSVAPSASVPASPTVVPTPTPEPSLSLDPPAATDPREIEVSVATDVDDESGEVVVTVTSHADDRIDEVVLRWSTELDARLFLRPFVPTAERIADGGPPLRQEWTKWVVGPGERGEPAGTTSLGYGPLLAGATLTIPLDATRLEPGPVAFDLQLLAGEGLLTLTDGGEAELRVEVP
ncbi:MAG TPA: hypothetical protein VFW95_05050 [Candidatus Limnocylindria bacterium]|nr:hypothetical protein [Candidatus Limnocylindria bacterium]